MMMNLIDGFHHTKIFLIAASVRTASLARIHHSLMNEKCAVNIQSVIARKVISGSSTCSELEDRGKVHEFQVVMS